MSRVWNAISSVPVRFREECGTMNGLVEVERRKTLGKYVGCGLRVTLFLRKIIYGRYTVRAPRCPTRLADTMAMRKATFMERYSSEHEARGSNGTLVRDRNTKVRSHGGVGALGCR